mmetsp:Transcript_13240/g.25353  ORF Transcript_13240/g.25353 Transcript_13240/m.25353 type:complete len:498 (-) Transcript_13240:8-1501(-)
MRCIPHTILRVKVHLRGLLRCLLCLLRCLLCQVGSTVDQLPLLVKSLAEGDESDAVHVRLQTLWDFHTVRSLVVLQHAAQSALRCRERAIQKMDVLLGLLRSLLGLPVPHLQPTALIVRAVAARHQLAIGLGRGEPRLEVVLLGGGVVERARDDVHDAVREPQVLIKRLRVGEHLLLHLPGVVPLARGDAELLHLLELVHAENAERVAPVGANLLAEASGVPGVPLGQVLGRDPRFPQHGAQRLLGGGNQVLVLALSRHLVQLLVELLELRALRHALLAHEVGRVHGLVRLCKERAHGVVDERQVQQATLPFEVEAARARHLLPLLELRDVKQPDQVHVVVQRLLRSGLHLAVVAPRLLHAVVVFVVVHGHRVVNKVADLMQQLGDCCLSRRLLLLGCLRRLLCRLTFGNEFSCVLSSLLQFRHLLVGRVEVAIKVIQLVSRIAPLRILLDHFVDPFNRCITASLRLANDVGIATLLDAKEVNIKHGDRRLPCGVAG